MILTCPECATGYFVDDAQITAAGRKVRCAACGARWTAFAEPALELVPPEEEGAVGKAPAADVDAAPLTGEDLPRAFRSRAEEEKRLRRAAVTGAVWAGAAVVLAILVGAAIVFRESVVRVWPPTASAYRAIGLPVNPIGLVIEDVRAEPSLQEGHATLAVSGVIRNVVDRQVSAPPLRVSLFNAQGKRVAGQIDVLANAVIPPGGVRHFVTAIFDPPFSARDLQVDFAVGARGQPLALRADTASAKPQPVALRGAATSPAFTGASNATPLADANAAPAAQ